MRLRRLVDSRLTILAAITTGLILIPVNVTRMTRVLTGVFVMPTFLAAIVATMIAAAGAFGNKSVAAKPSHRISKPKIKPPIVVTTTIPRAARMKK